MKKFLAILLAAMMLLAVTAAYADYTITYPTTGINTDHTYEIYQIFTGDLSTNADGDPILSNVVWGQNAASTYTEGDAVSEEILNTLMGTSGSDQDKLTEIKKYVDLTGTAFRTLTKDPGTVTVPAGYYLIKDKDGTQADKHDAYTTYIVNVLNSLTISPKAVYPEVDKEVWDEVGDDDIYATGNDGWGESADHAINESFDFRLTAELPASTKYADYPTYKVTFVDTMSSGITFEQIDSVTVDGITVTDYTCTATAGQAGGSWELTIADLKTIVDPEDETKKVNLTDGAEIVVVYSAHLNENCEKFNASADATSNKNGVKLKYSNNPNAAGEGETPEDFVWLFTYTVNNTKYANTAADGNELAGAGFTLFNGETAVKLIDNEDGTYTVANQSLTEGVVTEMTTQANGIFNIIGLDAGTYTLKETTVPAGYNKMDDVTIVVSATHGEEADTHAEMELASTSTMDNDHVNKSGATLPETGGIGTTLFYLFGGLMAAGSALILVVRRRADADEE